MTKQWKLTSDTKNFPASAIHPSPRHNRCGDSKVVEQWAAYAILDMQSEDAVSIGDITCIRFHAAVIQLSCVMNYGPHGCCCCHDNLPTLEDSISLHDKALQQSSLSENSFQEEAIPSQSSQSRRTDQRRDSPKKLEMRPACSPLGACTTRGLLDRCSPNFYQTLRTRRRC